MTQNSKFIILSITLKIFHSSSLHVFWGETEFLSLLFYRWGTFFLPSVSFKIEKKIIFIFLYLQFEYNMPRCSYFDIYPTWYSLRFLDMWFSVDINLGKIVILLSNIASVTFFFLLLLFPERNVCYTFCGCPKVLEYFVLLLLFYLLFSWRVSIFFTSSSSEILSLAMSSLLMSPSKAFFISIIAF